MKHIVYKYGDDLSDEVGFDLDGVLSFTEGDILSRRGLWWKVDSIQREENVGMARIPTYWVYLSRVEQVQPL